MIAGNTSISSKGGDFGRFSFSYFLDNSGSALNAHPFDFQTDALSVLCGGFSKHARTNRAQVDIQPRHYQKRESETTIFPWMELLLLRNTGER